VTGDVTIGPRSRVLHCAVINGDLGPITIGSEGHRDGAWLLRGRAGHPAVVGDAVLVGPHTHLNAATVDDEVFIATGVSMVPGSRVSAGCELRINSVAHVNSILEPGTVVPIGWIAAWQPAELFSPCRLDEL
jgi:gamma-carbonic anhydrase